MDFFKKVVGSVGSGKSGCAPNFPYAIQEPPWPRLEGFPWMIYKGQGTKDNEAVTVFVADIARHEASVTAKNMLHRLRTLRHPVILRYLASAETAKQLFIAVESVVPISCCPDDQWKQSDYLLWLIFDLVKAIRFLNEEATIIHGNLRPHALFLTVAGELRLGGFELATKIRDEESLLSDFMRYLGNSHRLDWPPELSSPSQSIPWCQLKALPLWTIDSFMLGRLIEELFKDLVLPLEIVEYVKRATMTNPRERRDFSGLAKARVFANVKMIKIAQSFGDIAAMDPQKRDLFLIHVRNSLDAIPPQYIAYRIAPTLGDFLPQFLAHDVSLEGIRLYLQSSSKLPDSEITGKMAKGLKTILAKPDRAIRLVFLETLPLFAKKLDPSLIQELLYPALLEGFSDSLPLLREGSLKASLLIASKLTSRQRNGELVRLYSRFQTDEQPSIRVNTVVCIGNVAKFLEPNLRDKFLISAYVRALGDPFVPVRVAVLAAIPVTLEFLNDDGIAKQLLPAICQLLVDPNHRVRMGAFNIAEMLLKRLRANTCNDLESTGNSEECDQEETPQTTFAQTSISSTGTISGWADKLMSVALGCETSKEQTVSSPKETKPPDGDGWNMEEGDILNLEIRTPPKSPTEVEANSKRDGLWEDDNPWSTIPNSDTDPWTFHNPAKPASGGGAARRPQNPGKSLSLIKPSLLKDL